jgi:hypothetical protein
VPGVFEKQPGGQHSWSGARKQNNFELELQAEMQRLWIQELILMQPLLTWTASWRAQGSRSCGREKRDIVRYRICKHFCHS